MAALSAKGISTHVGLPYSAFKLDSNDTTSDEIFRFSKDLDEVIIYLHSSGTTGLPKPIPSSSRQLLFAVSCHQFDNDEEAQGLNVSSLPLFHGFGLVAPGLAMSAAKPSIYPATDGIPTAQSMIDLIKASKAKSMMTVPFLLDDMCNMPNNEGIEVLSTLDFVGTGGAALGAGVGQRLTEGGVKLLNFYGTTEAGPLSLVFVPKDAYDWRYFRLRPDVEFKLAELDPRDGERLFRLTVYPCGGTTPEEISDQLIRNENFPNSDFAPVGRDDDIIVLATGEKANPAILETMLSEAPGVKSAIAFGENRFNLGVIIEPAMDVPQEKEEEFKNSIWPIILAAGAKMDASSHIPSPDAIIIVPSDVRIPRTDKGSIPRKEVYALFAERIEQTYQALLAGSSEAVEALDIDNLANSLKELIQTHWKVPLGPGDWTADDSLLTLGVDSLQALQLRRNIIAAVSKTEAFHDTDVQKLIPPGFLYVNSSVNKIAAALQSRELKPENSFEAAANIVDDYVNKFAIHTLTRQQKTSPAPTQGAVVLLSGSSGSLGAHSLASFVRSSATKQVICLIRKTTLSEHTEVSSINTEHHKTILQARGINLTDAEHAKIRSVVIDPSKEGLGLSDSVYRLLQNEVTHIVHTAWPMNYLMTVQAFEEQFTFLNSLLNLAGNAPDECRRRFIFVSSIATAARAGFSSQTPVPEVALDTRNSSCGIGYADAKLVCEKILEGVAADYSGQLEISIVRCGQLTGAKSTGIWNHNEQIPMLLKSAQSTGNLPEMSGVSRAATHFPLRDYTADHLYTDTLMAPRRFCRRCSSRNEHFQLATSTDPAS